MLEALNHSKKRKEELEERIRTLIPSDPSTSLACAAVQNKEITLKLLRKEIEDARNRRRMLLHKKTELLEKDKEIEAKKVELIKSNQRDSENLKEMKEEREKLITICVENCNKLKFRRKIMINDLYKIYFLENQYHRFFKKKCSCIKHDVIYGLHLPIIPTKNEHSDNELAAALSHIVNLLVTFGWLTNYSWRHPMLFKGSQSSIINRNTDESYSFYYLALKSRPKLIEAIGMLAENVTQLRSDCGLETTENERIIPNISDFLLFVLGKYNATVIHDRPHESIFSIASLVPSSSSDSSKPSTSHSTPPKNPTNFQSILDVVTASPMNYVTAGSK